MKTLKLLFILQTLLFTSISAQQKVDAGEIIKKINDNEKVFYENAVVSGNLNFTRLNNMHMMQSGNNPVYLSVVDAPVEFINCSFTGKVIASHWDEATKSSYFAHFKNKITFKNCQFKDKSDFQHSKFYEAAIFSGSAFT